MEIWKVSLLPKCPHASPWWLVFSTASNDVHSRNICLSCGSEGRVGSLGLKSVTWSPQGFFYPVVPEAANQFTGSICRVKNYSPRWKNAACPFFIVMQSSSLGGKICYFLEFPSQRSHKKCIHFCGESIQSCANPPKKINMNPKMGMEDFLNGWSSGSMLDFGGYNQPGPFYWGKCLLGLDDPPAIFSVMKSSPSDLCWNGMPSKFVTHVKYAILSIHIPQTQRRC